MGDSNTPINTGVAVHHHSQESSQGGVLKSDLTEVEITDGTGNYVSLEGLVLVG
tara:strand:+ start:1291 stop:1452 length:162 start_codon:yes stop_codon:yes gene_type:complete